MSNGLTHTQKPIHIYTQTIFKFFDLTTPFTHMYKGTEFLYIWIFHMIRQFALSLLFFAASLNANTPYMELIEKCITNTIYKDPIIRNEWEMPTVEYLIRDKTNLQTLTEPLALHALNNIMHKVIENEIPGDFIETGVWRGGTCIYMRAFLKDNNIKDRKVWVADSFEGVPPPSYIQDEGIDLYKVEFLAVSLEEVQKNFQRYNLLDKQVKFLKGWFKDTLHQAPIDKLAILRLDGDLYESTMDALKALYDKVSIGGYIMVDDYGCIEACAKAIHDFRDERGITDQIIPVNYSVVYWKKS